MKYKFSEIVDIPKLQHLMERLYIASGFPSGIVDIDGNILVAVGWHEICTKYHRVNCETEQLCRQSDKYIERHLNRFVETSEPYIWYKCANGLIDAAAPIIIDGEHLASIFQGQFLFEEPDVDRFREQAKKYGFDEEDYIKSLATVPIYSVEKLHAIMEYYRQLAEMVAHLGLARLRLLESQEKALRDSEERLKTIINNTPDVAIQSYDKDGRILFLNQTTESMFGWTYANSIGKTLDQLILDNKTLLKLGGLLNAADESNKPAGEIEWNFQNEEGSEKNIYSTLFPIQFAGGKKEFIRMDIDITGRKRFEKEIYRIGQLDLVGEMAASIGHEVRNPMTTVRGFLQMLGNKDENQKNKEYFDLMIQELDRANSIITEFLSLAKDKVMKFETKNLNTIVGTLAPLIEANALLFNNHLKLELGEIPELLLDEKEIRQLILNLVRNGIEAMPSGGCLTIKTFMENSEIVLAIQDEGYGIAPELMDKLGTPFFSTKDQGTGLGLAVCYSIAARHNAKVLVESVNGRTIFCIRFNPMPSEIPGRNEK